MYCFMMINPGVRLYKRTALSLYSFSPIHHSLSTPSSLSTARHTLPSMKVPGISLLVFLACTASISALSTLPSGTLVVSKSPSPGQYESIMKAVKALSTTTTAKQTIYIKKGEYKEQVVIPLLRSPLTIYGETSTPLTYTGNTVNIIHSAGQSDGLNNDQTGTLRVLTPNFSLYNVNVYNQKGRGTQAVALSAQKENQGYYGVSIIGYQDTLLAQKGAQFYAKSYIEGAVDFMFGDARAVFHDCDIGVSAGGGYILANARNTSDLTSLFLVDKCRINAAEKHSVEEKTVYLGRPWGTHSTALVQRTDLGKIINPKGWSEWSKTDQHTDNAILAELDNTGEGASGERASFAKKLRSYVPFETVLGPSYRDWVDSAYVSS